jgi:hypothetical protein
MSDLRSSGVPNLLLGAKKFVTWYLNIISKRKNEVHRCNYGYCQTCTIEKKKKSKRDQK